MSSDKSKTTTRRGFVQGAMGVVAAVPVAALVSSRRAMAEDMPKVAEDDAQAVALNYVHDAGESDKAPEGQNCANCQLYSGGDKEWGPCAIFAGKAVSAKGWCSAWAQRVG